MPHIHTGRGEHDLTATAFITRLENGTARGLLHRHRTLEMLLPVGGHVEICENPWAAVIHEIEEESGYHIDQLHVLQPAERIMQMDGVKAHPTPLYLQTHEFKQGGGHFHVDVGFAFVTDSLPIGLPVDGESTDLQWLTADEIQERRREMPIDVAQIFNFVLKTAVENWEQVDPKVFDA